MALPCLHRLLGLASLQPPPHPPPSRHLFLRSSLRLPGATCGLCELPSQRCLLLGEEGPMRQMGDQGEGLPALPSGQTLSEDPVPSWC